MEIQETQLPGVGLRHDLSTRSGRQLGVVTHQTGRRDLIVYDMRDPDACQEVVHLTEDESDALADLSTVEAAQFLIDKIQKTPSNSAFLSTLVAPAPVRRFLR